MHVSRYEACGVRTMLSSSSLVDPTKCCPRIRRSLSENAICRSACIAGLASWVPPADPSRSMLKVVRPEATEPRLPVFAASSASTGFAVLDSSRSKLGACWQAWLKSPLNAGGAWTYHLAPWRHRRQRCIPRGFRPAAKSTACLVSPAAGRRAATSQEIRGGRRVE